MRLLAASAVAGASLATAPAAMAQQGVAAPGATAPGATALGADSSGRLSGLAPVLGKYCDITQLGVFGDVTTILGDDGLYYRRGSGGWTKSPISLSGAHALTRLPDGRWLILDTEKHRLIQVDDLAGAGMVVRTELAGIKLKRPHNVVVDPLTGYVYVIAGDRRLFRFKTLEGPAEAWTFKPAELGYARSVSWFDGHIHIIHSSRGEVLRIDDFDRRRYTRFSSPRPRALRGATSLQVPESHIDFDAGSLASTGLVLNDVQKSGGWYYGSNDFLVGWAMGQDTRPARLIRWKTWSDFQNGEWQDLSGLIPQSYDPLDPLVPYYITIRDGILYTPIDVSLDEEHCGRDSIFHVDTASLPEE
ncbi:MAG: hypothetical protein P4L73_06115 [Caulobacteraceae bacterium]|nr:hypothetical protein [Caulobacteraceae bacterium]